MPLPAKFPRQTARQIVLAAVVIAILALAGCGDKKPGSGGASAASARVNAAAISIAKIRTGTAEIDADISGGGIPGGLKVKGGGPFDLKAKRGGAYDLDFTANFAGQSQPLGFTAVAGRTYFKFGDKAFATGKTGEKSSSPIGSFDVGSLIGMVKALNKYLTDIKASGTKTVDGQRLDVFTANVDLKKLAAEKDKSKARLPQIPGVPSGGTIDETFSSMKVTIGIAGDGIPRSVGLDAVTGGGSDGSQAGNFTATLDLLSVNDPVHIERPKNVAEGEDALSALGSLFGAFGG